MKKFLYSDMVKGWFVGGFEPSAFHHDDVEVAIKHYKSGFYENSHYHSLTNEITFIIKGDVKMNDQIYGAGDIIVLDLNESTDFRCLSDVTTCCVKIRAKGGDLTKDKHEKGLIQVD